MMYIFVSKLRVEFLKRIATLAPMKLSIAQSISRIVSATCSQVYKMPKLSKQRKHCRAMREAKLNVTLGERRSFEENSEENSGKFAMSVILT